MNKSKISLVALIAAIFLSLSGALLLNNNGNETNAVNISNNEQKNFLNKNKKVLTAYFSYSGNTELLAKEIQNQVGGDLFEIKRKKEYMDVTEEAKQEIENNERPELVNKITNIDDYDIVFVGYPVWWHKTPAVVNTFLESHDLSKKTVIPFCTSASSDISETIESFKASCSSTNILEGITISGSSATTDAGKNKIKLWLEKLGI